MHPTAHVGVANRNQTLTHRLGCESSPFWKLKEALQRLGVHIPVNPHATAAKLDLNN